jgi:hypothetical protein
MKFVTALFYSYGTLTDIMILEDHCTFLQALKMGLQK